MSLPALVLASSLALLPRAPGGDDKPAAADRLLTPRVERMVDKAHAFLIDHQNANGSFSIVRNDANASAPIAMTNLAILSFMALTGFLIGPPLIGFIAEVSGLRVGLAVLLVPLAVSLAFTRMLKASF